MLMPVWPAIDYVRPEWQTDPAASQPAAMRDRLQTIVQNQVVPKSLELPLVLGGTHGVRLRAIAVGMERQDDTAPASRLYVATVDGLPELGRELEWMRNRMSDTDLGIPDVYQTDSRPMALVDMGPSSVEAAPGEVRALGAISLPGGLEFQPVTHYEVRPRQWQG
jgi:hypothetical protein